MGSRERLTRRQVLLGIGGVLLEEIIPGVGEDGSEGTPETQVSEFGLIFPRPILNPSKEIKETPPKVIFKGPLVNKIALTVDDCLSLSCLQAMCDFSEKYQVPLTFFPSGELMTYQKWKVFFERIIRLGGELQNHSWSHCRLTKETREKREGELTKAQEQIKKISGNESNSGKYFRPPYGSYDPELVYLAWELGLRTVRWSQDSGGTRREQDGSLISSGQVLSNLNNVGKGDIVLMHANSNDAGALEDLYLQILKPRGLVPVALSSLLEN